MVTRGPRLRAPCSLLLFLAIALMACQAFGPVPTAGPRAEEGRLVLYLNGPSKTPWNLTLELVSVEALREDGASFPILTEALRLNSLDVVGRQLLLAETFLPQGRYEKLRLRIPTARLHQEGKGIDLAVPPEGFLLPVGFEIRPAEATPLFLTWEVERTIEREAFLRPAFTFEGRARTPRGVIAYVSNEGSDTVSVIDRSTDRVVDVILVGKAPRGIAISPDTSRAFVVNSGSSTLSILDVNTNRVLHTVNLEAGASPSDLAIAPDGRTLYVVNTALNTVSALDPVSFQTLQTIPVGLQPVALALAPRGALLLVANSGSHTVSVVDTSRHLVVTTIPVEFQPVWVAVEPTGALAFVAHQGSPRLTILSLSTLRVVKTVNGGIATAVLPDETTGRVFLARGGLNRVSFFDVNLNAELDSVAVGADPYRLALDPDRGKLYVVNRGSDSVTVLDRASRRIRAVIPVGRHPSAIAVVR